MLLKIVYLLTCRVFGMAVLAFRGDWAEDAELLVLRHENAVLRLARRPGTVRAWRPDVVRRAGTAPATQALDRDLPRDARDAPAGSGWSRSRTAVGRVHGLMTFCWDGGDEAGRRLAAVQLAELKAATQQQIADAFGIGVVTLWRWLDGYRRDGLAGLAAGKRGPKRPSKLTPELTGRIGELAAAGKSQAAIAAAARKWAISPGLRLRSRGRRPGASTIRPRPSVPLAASASRLPPGWCPIRCSTSWPQTMTNRRRGLVIVLRNSRNTEVLGGQRADDRQF